MGHIVKPHADPEDMERLAYAEHRQWGHWTAYMLKELKKAMAERQFCFDLDDDDSVEDFFDSLPCVDRWNRQIETSYDELSEDEKESDRSEVRLKLPVYRKQ